MPTDQYKFVCLSAILILSCTGAALAQEAKAPIKTPVESAVTPVEQIQLKGRTLKLDLKTLAELQRAEQEKQYKEKLQKLLSGPQNPGAGRTPALASLPAEGIALPPNPAVIAKLPAPKPKLDKNTVMAVYGPSNDMIAEVFISEDQVMSLKKGDQWDGREISQVNHQGVTIQGATTVRVGSSLKR